MFRIFFMYVNISTHTSLAGRDKLLYQRFPPNIRISTHTSLAGRDPSFSHNSLVLCKFLLTRPSRDVTEVPCLLFAGEPDFYSHVPRGT